MRFLLLCIVVMNGCLALAAASAKTAASSPTKRSQFSVSAISRAAARQRSTCEKSRVAIAGVVIFQAKDSAYTLNELFKGAALAEMYRDGCYVTLRLTSNMYHRFHYPPDGVVTDVRYISGDTWDVNAPARKRVARLFCKNERAVISLDCAHLSMPYRITLVPVAAVLVAGIRLHF